MRRSVIVLVLVLLAACDREADYQYLCQKFADEQLAAAPDPTSWVKACVQGRWSPKQMECHARAGAGGFQAMFCDE